MRAQLTKDAKISPMQAALFAAAAVVVAPHGSGLANVLFCSPGAVIIELLPWYESFCSTSNLQFTSTLVESNMGHRSYPNLTFYVLLSWLPVRHALYLASGDAYGPISFDSASFSLALRSYLDDRGHRSTASTE